MVREGFLDEPGVAQAVAGELLITTILGNTKRIPLSTVRLTKIRKNRFLGRYSWWGKTIFYLDSPQTNNLAIGVDDPTPWQSVFENKEQ
jgi:hypothetical protein